MWRESFVCFVLKSQLEKEFEKSVAQLKAYYEKQKEEMTIKWQLDFENQIELLQADFGTEKNLFKEKEALMAFELKRLDDHYKNEIDKILEAMKKTESDAEMQLATINKSYKKKFQEALSSQKEMFEKEKSELEAALKHSEERLQQTYAAQLEVALNEKEVQCYETFEEEKQRLLKEFNDRLDFLPHSKLNTMTRLELQRLASPERSVDLNLSQKTYKRESQVERDQKFISSLRSYETTPSPRLSGRKSSDWSASTLSTPTSRR